jgi:hypothetical protein
MYQVGSYFLNRSKILIAHYYEKTILKFCLMIFLVLFCIPKTVDVVQLVRTSDCGSESHGFESHLPPKYLLVLVFRLAHAIQLMESALKSLDLNVNLAINKIPEL